MDYNDFVKIEWKVHSTTAGYSLFVKLKWNIEFWTYNDQETYFLIASLQFGLRCSTHQPWWVQRQTGFSRHLNWVNKKERTMQQCYNSLMNILYPSVTSFRFVQGGPKRGGEPRRRLGQSSLWIAGGFRFSQWGKKMHNGEISDRH